MAGTAPVLEDCAGGGRPGPAIVLRGGLGFVGGHFFLLLVALVCLALPGQLLAAEFRSVGSDAAVLWDSPSNRGKKLFVAPKGMPLEVLSTVNTWIKVRDMAGDVLWIERGDLVARRTLVATALATVRSQPQESAPVAFQVERGVTLELTEALPSGWARVKHRDGAVGFVKATEVWGL